MEAIKKNLEERSKKTISVLKEDLNTVRAGRANPALLIGSLWNITERLRR